MGDLCHLGVGVCQGLFGTFISTLLFGFCTSFPGVLTTRLIWGALNGNIGISKAEFECTGFRSISFWWREISLLVPSRVRYPAKCYIAERTHPKHQALAWNFYSFAGSFGRIVVRLQRRSPRHLQSSSPV